MKYPAVFRRSIPLLIPILLMLVSGQVMADDARLPGAVEKEIAEFREQGKFSEALAKLEAREKELAGELDISFLVLKARLLEENGSFQESVSVWNGVALREPSLKYFARSRVTDLLLRIGDAEEAELSISRLAGGIADKRNLDQVLGLAQLFLKQGKNKKAETYFLKALKLTRRSGKADSARIGLAKSRIAMGNKAGAVTNLRYMQVNFRAAALFKEAADLEKLISTRVKVYTEDEYRQIAKRLTDYSSFDLAKAVLTEWSVGHPKSSQKDRMDLYQIEALYRERENDAALQLCLLFPGNHPKSGLKFSVRFKELLLYQRTGQTEKLVTLGEKLWRGKMGGRLSNRRNAGLLMASYLVSIGKVDQGLSYYREVYRSGAGSSTKKDILWRVGVGAIRGGQGERAASNLRLLLQKNPKGEVLASVLYWLAKAEKNLGNEKAALKHLIRLEVQFPNHYYNVMSMDDLREYSLKQEASWLIKTRKTFSKKHEEFPDLQINNNIRKNKYFRAAVILSQAGLTEEAAAFSESLQRVYRRDKAVAMLTARAHSAAGNHLKTVRTIYNHFRNFLYQEAEGMPTDFWHLYYPRPFWDEVTASAARYNIDPALMVSLMRQESRFDPRARSWVGAIGLFQIMPYTAEEIAPLIGLGDISAEDLYNPEINVAIASELASRLFNLFKDDRSPIIASYNAGEARVNAWWQAAQRENISEDLFIDTIPYKETRGFVRQVLSNYFSYKRIYGKKDFSTD